MSSVLNDSEAVNNQVAGVRRNYDSCCGFDIAGAVSAYHVDELDFW